MLVTAVLVRVMKFDAFNCFFLYMEVVQFSSEELSLFARRFDNGYDLQQDERYNLWLSQKVVGAPPTRRTESTDSDGSGE